MIHRKQPNKGYYALLSQGEVVPHHLTDIKDTLREVISINKANFV